MADNMPNIVEEDDFKLFEGDDATLTTGWLSKRTKNNKSWRKRFFCVDAFHGILCYYKSEKDFKKQMQPRGQLPLDRVLRIKTGEKSKEFYLEMQEPRVASRSITTGGTVELQAASEEDRDFWISAIQECPKASLPPTSQKDDPNQWWKNPDLSEDPAHILREEGCCISEIVAPHVLRTFASRCKQSVHPKGRILFDYRIPGSYLYWIIEGHVTLSTISGQRAGHQLGVKSPGSFIGMSSFVGDKRIIEAKCSTDVVCLEMPEVSFEDWERVERDEKQRNCIKCIFGFSAYTELKCVFPDLKMTDTQLHHIASLFEYKVKPPGSLLFEEGDEGDSMFILKKGLVKAIAENSEGEAMTLHEFIEGGFFGEVSLITGIPRTATIECDQPSLFIEIKRNDFMHALSSKMKARILNIGKIRVAEQLKKYKVPFFEAFAEEEFSILAKLCDLDIHPSGKVLMTQGELGDSFHLIVHGKCEVAVDDKKVGEMGPGKYFGEIALIQQGPRTATVVCQTKCVILSMTLANFEVLFELVPEAIADFELRLGKNVMRLRSLLYHPIGIKYFTKFLEQEYSDENIRFWKACREWRHMPEHETIKQQQLQMKYKKQLEENEEKKGEDGDGTELDVHPAFRNLRPSLFSDGGSVFFEAETITEEAVEAARKTVKDVLQSIYDKYISENAEHQVNVDTRRRTDVQKRLQEDIIDNSALNDCVNEIEKLMQTDSFKRFMRSDLIDKILEEAGGYVLTEERSSAKKRRPDRKFRTGSVITASSDITVQLGGKEN